MKKILLSALAICAMAVNANAIVGCQAEGCYNVDVEIVLVATNGDILVSTSGVETLANCTPTAGSYMTIPVNSAGKNAMYSMFLTAKTTKGKVSMNINPGSAGCTISYASLRK